MLRKFLLSLTAVAAMTGAAVAADLPNTKEAPVYTPPPSWTGFYIGANAGYGWTGNFSSISGGDPASQLWMTTALISPTPWTTSLHQSGFVGGGQIGYNYQFNTNWVAGFESDIDYAHVSGHGSTIDPPNLFPFVTNMGRTLDWFGTARARIGILITPSFLLYGTGGFAYGETHANGNVLLAPPFPGAAVVVSATPGFEFACAVAAPSIATCYSGSGSRVSVGWTAGAGMEYRLFQNVTLKAEYLHVDLGGETVRMNSPPPSTAGVFANAIFNREALNVVRAGLNYQFDFASLPAW